MADWFEVGAQEGRQLGQQPFPEAGTGPAGGQSLQFMFQAQGAAMVFELADLFIPEVALAAQFAPLLFSDGGDTDGGQFIFLAVKIAGEAQTELTGIEAIVFAAALGVQAHRTDEQAVGTDGGELMVQGVTEAAAFIDRPDGVAGADFFVHPLDQAGQGEALGRFGVLMVRLDGGGDLLEVDVQAQFDCGIALGGIWCRDVHVMSGLMVCLIRTIRRVPRWHPLVNPSWHLTPTAP